MPDFEPDPVVEEALKRSLAAAQENLAAYRLREARYFATVRARGVEQPGSSPDS